MSQIVNEKSPLFMTMIFKDEFKAPLIPATLEWRLDDMETDPPTEVVPWTSIPSPAATTLFTIPGSKNLIGDPKNIQEGKMFGLRVNDTLTNEAHAQFAYHVLNITGPS